MAATSRKVNDVRHDKTGNPDGNTAPRKPVQPVEQGQGFPQPAHPMEPAEGRPDLDGGGARVLAGSHFSGTPLDVPGNLGDRSVVKKAASEREKETRAMEQTNLPELWEWAEYY